MCVSRGLYRFIIDTALPHTNCKSTENLVNYNSCFKKYIKSEETLWITAFLVKKTNKLIIGVRKIQIEVQILC